MSTRSRRFWLTLLGVAVLCSPAAAITFRACAHWYTSCNTSNTAGLWVTQEPNPSNGSPGLGSAVKAEINTPSSTSPALIGTITQGTGSGVYGYTNSTADPSGGVWGNTIAGNGVLGTSTSGDGVRGVSNGGTTTTGGTGVLGASLNGGAGILGYAGLPPIPSFGPIVAGVRGESAAKSTYGVLGNTQQGVGVQGYAAGDPSTGASGIGVAGIDADSSQGGYGVYGSSTKGEAGHFDGNATVTGTLYYGNLQQTSDARYKTNIEPITNALDSVRVIQGVRFDWRTNEFPDMHFSKSRQIGVIGQEVEKVLPELVSKDKNGMRCVSYVGLVPVLLEALKEQQKEIESLKNQVKDLSNK